MPRPKAGARALYHLHRWGVDHIRWRSDRRPIAGARRRDQWPRRRTAGQAGQEGRGTGGAVIARALGRGPSMAGSCPHGVANRRPAHGWRLRVLHLGEGPLIPGQVATQPKPHPEPRPARSHDHARGRSPPAPTPQRTGISHRTHTHRHPPPLWPANRHNQSFTRVRAQPEATTTPEESTAMSATNVNITQGVQLSTHRPLASQSAQPRPHPGPCPAISPGHALSTRLAPLHALRAHSEGGRAPGRQPSLAGLLNLDSFRSCWFYHPSCPSSIAPRLMCQRAPGRDTMGTGQPPLCTTRAGRRVVAARSCLLRPLSPQS